MNTSSSPSYSSVFLFLAFVALALGIAFAGSRVADGVRQFRSFDRYVTVKGLATKDLRADLAVWNLTFTITGDDLAAAQAELESNRVKVEGFLVDNGLKSTDIRIQSVQVSDKQAQTYSSGESTGPRYVLSQSLIARTTDIDAMLKASQATSHLVGQGVVLGQPNGGYNPAPQFVFTQLNDIKPAMIAEATKNARSSAEQFAKDSGQNIGVIRTASQGVFEVLPRDPNIPEAETPDKTVRVVTTVGYYLAD